MELPVGCMRMKKLSPVLGDAVDLRGHAPISDAWWIGWF